MKKLGILKNRNVREIWGHEAYDFTKWLSKSENISQLLDEISVSAENIKTEDAAGRFNVDITADEVETGKKIIIENQLEATDHKHLGQLLTYASSFDASIIVWVVADYREEHKQAIDWFNDNISNKISFFLVKIEMWQIGESEPAPKFHVISEPNDWLKTVRDSSASRKLTETKLAYKDFWDGLKDYAIDKHKITFTRKAQPQYWFDISIGNKDCHICLRYSNQKKYIGAELLISDNKELYDKLFSNKRKLESTIGYEVSWLPLPNKKAASIACYYKNINIKEIESGNRDKYYEWLVLRQKELADAFYNCK